ncbi:MAG: hypothetical protein NTZ59_09180, partial [Bacteroidetes bacterium]|nr:hypothetical protein [Bacteroidota bacterium]
MMKKIVQLIILLVLIIAKNFAQCPNNGQNPTSAFPACGTAVFNQTSVPACNGQQIPVPVCSAAAGVFTDINPYYYKFTCYVSGPLEFNIIPNTSSDDYDWQLFDITGQNPNNIYTNPSMFVACNWSGETGTTGTSTTATNANGCEGTGVPLITKAPTLIAGHEYLLMVSHFTSTNQSGYNLTFSSASANLITDQNIPKITNVSTTCGGKEVYIKLNKKILCKSIAVNGSDFGIAGATIVNATGVGCTGAFDTDSIIVVLSGTLTTNNYLLIPKVGTDGNILVDNCTNNLDATGMSFAVYNKPNPNFTYQVINETCKADTLKYTHNGNNATNKWQWTFDGNPLTSNSQTQQVVYNSFIIRTVKLVVSNPLCIDSITQSIPIANHTLISKINAIRDTTCPNNPETFSDASIGNILSRHWDFKNGQTSNLQFPPTQTYPVLPINKFYDVSLVVNNVIGCRDSSIRSIFVRGTIPTEFDSIIPPDCAAKEVKIYFKQAMYCNSISTDGSEFTITGPSANSVIGATINCLDTVGTVVTLQLANSLTTGTYQLSLKTGSDGNTIINDCGIATLPKTLSFQALAHINPVFTYISKWGCKADTITFNHIANNNANNWNWNFTDGSPNATTSNIQNPTIIFSDVNNNHNVQLIVSNGVCKDTSNQQVNIIDHSIKAKYISPDTTCGFGGTIFKDSSKGLVTKWNWSFGLGLTSNLQNPNPVNYPLSYVYTTYATQLIAQNSVGCLDTTAIKNIVVKPSSPAQMDKLQYDICSPDSIIVYFNSPMLCNTVAPDGSDFNITGASSPLINSAYIVNCNNGLGKAVVLKLANAINTGGYYQINLKQGNDGNTILNDCGIATAP